MNSADYSNFICGLLGPNPCGSEDPLAMCIGAGSELAPIRACQCSSTFYFVNSDGNCEDVKECAGVIHGCGVLYCEEQIGGPPTCNPDSDPLKLCSPNDPCGANGQCQLSADMKSYSCACTAGYVAAMPNGQKETCIDIDECSSNSMNTCTIYEACTNTAGGYQCEHNPDPFGKCMGFNNKCTGNAQCRVSSDKLSSYCECPSGYFWGQSWDGQWACQDQDECSLGTHACSAYEYCANLPGTYYCGLHEGPCAYGQHECHPLALCRPSYSKRGYDCDCINGYTGNGNSQTGKSRHDIGVDHTHGSLIAYGPNGPKGCVDVDECASGFAQCIAGQVCVNTIGGFECRNEYDPMNHCAEGNHECHPLAVCTPNSNVKRGYDCTCKAGYSGNGNFQFGRQDAIAMGANGPKVNKEF